MRLTMTEELVIKRKRNYAGYWKEASNWFWFRRLFEEVLELAWALLGLGSETPQHELEQIATIAMNWMERGTRR